MKKIITAGVLSALALSSAWAQQSLVADQSAITFTAKQLGVAVNGAFKKFSADVDFLPADLAKSHIKVTVDTGSATMHNAEADSNLALPVWFNVAKFPQATFESTRIQSLGGGRYEATGKFTVKDVTQEVTVPVTLSQANGTTIASGSFPLERLTYKVGEDEWSDTSMVANGVKVDFKLAITGVPALP